MKYNKYLKILFILLVACNKKAPIKEPQFSKKIVKKSEPIDTLINSDNYLVIGNKKAKIKFINKKDSLKYNDYKIVESKDQILVVAKDLKEDTFEIYRKYNSKFYFTDFKVKLFKGELVEPNFATYPWAKQYITRITEVCKKGINFAGKYTLVIWGCGSPCQDGVIVDRTNGNIYKGFSSTYGSSFKKDSNLIIINSGLIDSETDLINFHTITEVSTKVWDGSGFKEL